MNLSISKKRDREFILKWLITVLFLAILVGCVTTPPEPEWYPASVAILPFTNETADFNVNAFSRLAMYNQLVDAGYEKVMALEEVDSRLEKIGVTLGGQLPTISGEELAEVLGTEAVIYGNILTAKRINVAVYIKKEFSASYTMKDPTTGEVFWVATEESKDSKVTLNPIEALKEGVTEAGGDLLARGLKAHPLGDFIEDVTRKCLKTYPNWKGMIYAKKHN